MPPHGKLKLIVLSFVTTEYNQEKLHAWQQTICDVMALTSVQFMRTTSTYKLNLKKTLSLVWYAGDLWWYIMQPLKTCHACEQHTYLHTTTVNLNSGCRGFSTSKAKLTF